MEKIVYSEDRRTAYFDGYKFRMDAKTGYYLANKPTHCGKRERLHCYVWRYFNGPIPDGYHIHHKDENKGNNEIDNLACVPVSEHTSYHSKKYSATHKEEIKKRLDASRRLASEWHRSQEGREWHSRHGAEEFKTMKKREYVCQQCGKKFMALPVGPDHKYCGNNCKSAARRKSGVDNETRTCIICGKEFTANKYSSARCCSRKCGSVLRSNKRDQMRGQRACLQHGG